MYDVKCTQDGRFRSRVLCLLVLCAWRLLRVSLICCPIDLRFLGTLCCDCTTAHPLPCDIPLRAVPIDFPPLVWWSSIYVVVTLVGLELSICRSDVPSDNGTTFFQRPLAIERLRRLGYSAPMGKKSSKRSSHSKGISPGDTGGNMQFPGKGNRYHPLTESTPVAHGTQVAHFDLAVNDTKPLGEGSSISSQEWNQGQSEDTSRPNVPATAPTSADNVIVNAALQFIRSAGYYGTIRAPDGHVVSDSGNEVPGTDGHAAVADPPTSILFPAGFPSEDPSKIPTSTPGYIHNPTIPYWHLNYPEDPRIHQAPPQHTMTGPLPWDETSSRIASNTNPPGNFPTPAPGLGSSTVEAPAQAARRSSGPTMVSRKTSSGMSSVQSASAFIDPRRDTFSGGSANTFNPFGTRNSFDPAPAPATTASGIAQLHAELSAQSFTAFPGTSVIPQNVAPDLHQSPSAPAPPSTPFPSQFTNLEGNPPTFFGPHHNPAPPVAPMRQGRPIYDFTPANQPLLRPVDLSTGPAFRPMNNSDPQMQNTATGVVLPPQPRAPASQMTPVPHPGEQYVGPIPPTVVDPMVFPGSTNTDVSIRERLLRGSIIENKDAAARVRLSDFSVRIPVAEFESLFEDRKLIRGNTVTKVRDGKFATPRYVEKVLTFKGPKGRERVRVRYFFGTGACTYYCTPGAERMEKFEAFLTSLGISLDIDGVAPPRAVPGSELPANSQPLAIQGVLSPPGTTTTAPIPSPQPPSALHIMTGNPEGPRSHYPDYEDSLAGEFSDDDDSEEKPSSNPSPSDPSPDAQTSTGTSNSPGDLDSDFLSGAPETVQPDLLRYWTLKSALRPIRGLDPKHKLEPKDLIAFDGIEKGDLPHDVLDLSLELLAMRYGHPSKSAEREFYETLQEIDEKEERLSLESAAIDYRGELNKPRTLEPAQMKELAADFPTFNKEGRDGRRDRHRVLTNYHSFRRTFRFESQHAARTCFGEVWFTSLQNRNRPPSVLDKEMQFQRDLEHEPAVALQNTLQQVDKIGSTVQGENNSSSVHGTRLLAVSAANHYLDILKNHPDSFVELGQQYSHLLSVRRTIKTFEVSDLPFIMQEGDILSETIIPSAPTLYERFNKHKPLFYEVERFQNRRNLFVHEVLSHLIEALPIGQPWQIETFSAAYEDSYLESFRVLEANKRLLPEAYRSAAYRAKLAKQQRSAGGKEMPGSHKGLGGGDPDDLDPICQEIDDCEMDREVGSIMLLSESGTVAPPKDSIDDFTKDAITIARRRWAELSPNDQYNYKVIESDPQMNLCKRVWRRDPYDVQRPYVVFGREQYYIAGPGPAYFFCLYSIFCGCPRGKSCSLSHLKWSQNPEAHEKVRDAIATRFTSAGIPEPKSLIEESARECAALQAENAKNERWLQRFKGLSFQQQIDMSSATAAPGLPQLLSGYERHYKNQGFDIPVKPDRIGKFRQLRDVGRDLRFHDIIMPHFEINVQNHDPAEGFPSRTGGF